jgi:hypothetical protein
MAVVINVRDYGATGDGVTDDTPFLQSAIAAASATGSAVLYLPAGAYRTTGPLVVDVWRASIRGDGPQHTFIAPELSTGQYALKLGWDVANETGTKRGPFDAVTGLTLAGAAGNGIAVGSLGTGGNAHSMTFRDVNIYGFDVQVDLVSYTYLLRFDRVFFTNPTTYAVRLDDVTSSGENISFDSCVFGDGPGTMVYLNKSGASMLFNHCSFDYCARAVWQRAGAMVFVACHFEAGTTYGGADKEYILIDRRGSVSRPMTTLAQCDLADVWDNYDTFIRLRGDNGDQGLRVIAPYVGAHPGHCQYLVRDDGPYRSSIVVDAAWYGRGDTPPLKVRTQAGSDVAIVVGERYVI